MKKITSWLLAITLLMNVAFITSCKKDDDDPDLAKIEGIEFTSSYGIVYISWDAVENADTYMVSVDGQNVSDLPFIVNEWALEQLDNGSEVTIFAYSDFTMSNLIATTTVEYESVSGNVVENIHFQDVGNNVIVTWSPVEGAVSYMVFTGGIPDTEYPITSTYYNAGSLMDGLEVKVEAYSDGEMQNLIATGKEYYSSEAVGTIENIVLSDNNGSVTITWDGYEDALSYMIKKNGVNILSNPISYTGYVVGTIINGDVISVEAYADYTGDVLIASGETTFISSEEPLLPVINLQEDELGSDYVILGWTLPSCDFTGVRIFDGEYVEGNIDNMVANCNAMATQTKISNLESGATYNFYVYVVNFDNEYQIYSDPISIMITLESGLNLDGTEWYCPSATYNDEMTLTFSGNTVDWADGDYFYNDLSYSYDPSSRTGIIDEGGFYNSEFVIDEGEVFLTLDGDLRFVRINKK